MTSPPPSSSPQRAQQLELQQTTVGRGTAIGLVAGFLVVILGIPLCDALVPVFATPPTSGTFGQRHPVVTLMTQPPSLLDFPFPVHVGNEPPREPSRQIERAIESASVARNWVQPHLQSWLCATFAQGNASVAMGLDSWLFFRPGIDYLTGEGFLRRSAHRQTSQGAGPLSTILDFNRQCRAAGVPLLLVPINDKAAIETGHFTGTELGNRPLHNSDFDAWQASLTAAGVTVLMIDDLLLQQAHDQSAFLRQDTHWTPATMESVARRIAHHPVVAAAMSKAAVDEPLRWRRDSHVISGIGDLAGLLRLPTGNQLIVSQSVTVDQVRDMVSGVPWQSDPHGSVLLLGDSFTNIYQTPELGWGEGAGLGAQLAWYLRRSIDVIAINGDGANGARQRLAARSHPFLGKHLVIWVFAERELLPTDWRTIDLGVPDASVRSLNQPP